METDVGDGPRGIQTDWPDMMATSIEEDINFDKVIENSSPFPPDNMPIRSSDSSVAIISHDPPNEHPSDAERGFFDRITPTRS